MNTIGQVGRTLYHNGYKIDDIAKALKVYKPELMISMVDELVEVYGIDWVKENHKENCKLTDTEQYLDY